MTYSTPLKKPCKDCPYRKGQIETFRTLYVEKEWFFDGNIQHGCHALNDYNGIEPDNHLGCLGSMLFAQKMLGFIENSEIKDLEEME